MRRSDYLPILEAIDTSAIDREARAELHDGLLLWLQQDWLDFTRSHGGTGDQHDQFDAYYQFRWEDEMFIRHLCTQASLILSDVTRKHLRMRYGEDITYQHEGWDRLTDKIVMRKRTITPGMIFVDVRAREHVTGDSPLKRAGGYFQGASTSPHIVVNVNSDEVFRAAMGLIQIIAVGEGEDYDLLTNVIAPVFAHEYAHLEQMLRGDPNTGRDLGYITTGGKRGNRRNPSGSPLDYLRYKSSAMEIDAFAAQAASELIANSLKYRRYGEEGISDTMISDILSSIATGYAESKSVEEYLDIGWGRWAVEAERLGIKPHEMMATYKRFLKLVYRHVSNYRDRRIGTRSRWNAVSNIPTAWKGYAKLPMKECAMLIAREITHNLLEKYPEDWRNADDLRYEDFWKASNFLHTAYFDDGEWNDARMDAVNASFRKLVIRLFMKAKERKKLQDAA